MILIFKKLATPMASDSDTVIVVVPAAAVAESSVRVTPGCVDFCALAIVV
jgi:hypothetical protein